MTLVEILVTITILLVGVLGTATMIDGANATTSQTKAREAATSLGRQVLETARSLPYRSLAGSEVLDALSTRPGLADSKPFSAGHQIASRGFTYDVAVDVCSLDDPKDQLGTHDGTVAFCPDTDALSGSAPAKDRNPDDYRRITVTLSWVAPPGRKTTRQTTIVSNPGGGLGPSVTRLDVKPPQTSPITGAASTAVAFDVETSSTPAEVDWSVNGATQGSAIGSGTAWSFAWPVVKADGSPTFYDGTYVVQAQAFDDRGRSGSPKAVTVVVNRIPPLAPRQVEGGRNLNGSRVDVEWQASPEPDVVGYRVYRGDTPGQLGTRVCPAAGASAGYTTTTSCLDEGAPAYSPTAPLHYTVVALDTAPDGSLREGTASAELPVIEGDTPPDRPAGLSACTGGAACNDVDGQPAPAGTTALSWSPSADPDAADEVYFYRVYRDGVGYANRYDRLYPVAGKPLVFIDGKPEGGPHEYRVSAVDRRFGESQLSAPVSR